MFNEGGAVMQKQMELFDEGGLLDEGGTVDPVSGNDVPPGSTQEEVRDDIPAQLSEGEFVFPADVVRFIGLEKLMQLRQEAKAGLARMEAMGQMGNSEEATIPDDIPFDIDDLEVDDDVLELQQGGVVPNITTLPSQFANYQPNIQAPVTQPIPIYTQGTPTGFQPSFIEGQTQPNVVLPSFQDLMPSTVIYVNPETGAEISIPVDSNGVPQIPIPPGFVPKSSLPDTPTPEPEPEPEQVVPASQIQQGRDDPSDEPPTFVGQPEIRTSGPGPLVQAEAQNIKERPEFQKLVSEIDTRNSFQKFTDNIFSLFGSDTAAEYAQAQREMAEGIAQEALGNNLSEEQIDELVRETRAALIEGMTGRPAGDFAPVGERAEPTVDPTKVKTATVKTATLTGDGAAGKVAQTAAERLRELLDEQLKGISEQQRMDLLANLADAGTGIINLPTRNNLIGYNIDISQFSPESRQAAQEYIQGIENSPDTDAGIKLKNLLKTSRQRRVEQTAASEDVGAVTPIISRQETPDVPISDAAARRRGPLPEGVKTYRENLRRNVTSYENKGYNPKDARDAAKNKTRADLVAQQQMRDRGESESVVSRTSAVTDRDGNPVRNASDRSVVMNVRPGGADPGKDRSSPRTVSRSPAETTSSAPAARSEPSPSRNQYGTPERAAAGRGFGGRFGRAEGGLVEKPKTKKTKKMKRGGLASKK